MEYYSCDGKLIDQACFRYHSFEGFIYLFLIFFLVYLKISFCIFSGEKQPNHIFLSIWDHDIFLSLSVLKDLF